MIFSAGDRRSVPWKARLSSIGSGSLAIGLVLLAALLPLWWFGRNWRLNQDGSLYLLAGSDLLAGRGYVFFGRDATLTVRGPVLPVLVALLIVPFGRDVEALAWAARALALLNPLLTWLLFRRLAGNRAAALAALLVAFFGYTATLPLALNVDAVMLSVYLLAILLLLEAASRGGVRLAALAGATLGAAILTKETALAGLPLALVAAALLGWSGRGLLAYYAGLLAVCAPWWLLVWIATEEVYLVGRVPGVVAAAFAAGGGAVLLLAAAALRGERTRGLLRDAGARRVLAWGGLLAWVALLTVALLSTSGQHTSRFQDVTFGEYVLGEVLRPTPLWFLLPLGVLYALRRAARGGRGWEFFLALLAVQVPIIVFVLTERWIARQHIVTQTLLYGALAAMAADLAPAVSARIRRGAGPTVRAAGVAILAVVALAAGAQAWTLLAERDDARASDPGNDDNPAMRDMSAWIDRNVPEGAHLLATRLYMRQLAFRDAGERRWTQLRALPYGASALLASAACGAADGDCPVPRHMVALQVNDDCAGRGMPMRGVAWQMNRIEAEYLLISGAPGYQGDGSLAWVDHLTHTGAFEVVHTAYLHDEPGVTEDAGLVLLRRTGREPVPMPTLMDPASVARLMECVRRAEGDGSSAAVRAILPHGITVVGTAPQAAIARSAVAAIYRPDGRLR